MCERGKINTPPREQVYVKEVRFLSSYNEREQDCMKEGGKLYLPLREQVYVKEIRFIHHQESKFI